MKRALTILLLILFTYNFLGAGFVYNFWLYSVKESVKERIEGDYSEKKKLIKVPVEWSEDSPPEFQWHEEQEFEYRGQMYDVIRQEQHGNEMWYYCHWDKAETELLNNLSQYVSNYLQQHPKDHQKTTSLSTYLDQTFLLVHGTALLTPWQHEISDTACKASIKNIVLDLDDPPPQPTMSCMV